MIEINLLPETQKKRQERFKKLDISTLDLQKIPVLQILLACAAFLAILQLVLFFAGSYTQRSYRRLDGEYKDILPKKMESDILKAQAEAINKKIAAINELMVNRFAWAKKLSDLSDCMIPGIWLSELHYDEKMADRVYTPEGKGARGIGIIPAKPVAQKVLTRYLIISGYALNSQNEGTSSIGKYIKTLKENSSFYSDFSDIELGAIKRDKIEDQEVMSFTITCLFK